MYRKLASLNPDLKRLQEKGFAVAIDSEHLIVRDIPYLDAAGHLSWGALVTKLVFIDQQHVAQENHQVLFAGGDPHEIDGTPIRNIGNRPHQLPLSTACSDVVIERSFSNKPASGKFADFFEKVESYVAIISGPAMAKHDATPYSFREVAEAEVDSVFKFHDTLTSRAEIADLAALFEDDIVALFGLGGSGAYLLDFLIKTPLKEIRGFDGDEFHVHTAYRSPGRLDPNEFGVKKAQVYQARYENFRHGLVLAPEYITQAGDANLDGVTFAFVCVDKGPSRAAIFDILIARGIPFIDVGMGLQRQGVPLSGMIRTTYFAPETAQGVRDQKLVEEGDAPDDLYKANIQISELNAMNAAVAIMLFKQLRGFYARNNTSYHLLFGIDDLKMADANRDPD